jgi:hypothetical protein
MTIVNRSFALAFALFLSTIAGTQTQAPASAGHDEVAILKVSSTVS